MSITYCNYLIIYINITNINYYNIVNVNICLDSNIIQYYKYLL